MAVRPRPLKHHQGLQTLFCVPTDELLRATDDSLSEREQSLSPREGEGGRKGMEKGKEKGREGKGWKGKDDLHLTSHTIFRPCVPLTGDQSCVTCAAPFYFVDIGTREMGTSGRSEK